MKQIPLTKGTFALVDDADFRYLSQFDWCWSNGYAVRSGRLPDGRYTTIRMHRELLGLVPGDGIKIDHWNLNKIDNRRKNLREATNSENGRNRGKNSNNTSGYKGVYWDRNRQLWMSAIMIDRRSKHLGRFSSPEEAHRAYKKAAELLHKDFANHGETA